MIAASSVSRSDRAEASHSLNCSGSPRPPEPAPAPTAASVERRLGAGLVRLRGDRLFRSLGFVRLSDYVTERLGLSHRTAKELIRVEEALVRLPAIAAAFDEGALTSSHVRTLARVATPATESFWLALARRSSVRELAHAATCGDSEALRATASEVSEHDDARASRLTLDAPAWMAVFWRDSAALVRRLVGSEATAGECLEVVLAEFGAGAGVEWTEGAVADTSAMVGDARRDLHASAYAGKTGEVLWMKEPYGEGVANRSGPESCAWLSVRAEVKC